MSEAIKPALVSGTKDMLPSEAIVLQSLFGRVRGVCERYGFVPIETPCFESWGVLTGNEPSFNKSLFRAKIVRGAEDKGIEVSDLAGSDTALRFDLTVPLARVVSANPRLVKPFKRYQTGHVFRGERPQSGRLREFTQFDFDIIGSRSVYADIEIIVMMYAIMTALGVDGFIIRINTRRLLNAVAELVGCADRSNQLFRIMDKVDKLGIDGVVAELSRKPENKYDESALALGSEQVGLVRQYLSLRATRADASLGDVVSMFDTDASVSAAEALTELRTIANVLRSLGVPEDKWVIDPSVARGLDYYTGPVFETYLTDMPELGSVLSGGRFDGLTNRFMPDSNMPGVGASVGVDRLMIGLSRLGLVEEHNTLTRLLVTVYGQDLTVSSLEIAQRARAAGVPTELYLGDDSSLRGQMSYAAKQGIPFVIILGPDEVKRQIVQIKNMETREQKAVPVDEAIALVLSV